jgi:hypothetical protein
MVQRVGPVEGLVPAGERMVQTVGPVEGLVPAVGVAEEMVVPSSPG